MNLTPTSFVIGALGIALGLSTNETILIAMVAAISASIPPAWAATLAPQTELRQIASARFTFGVWGTRLCSVLNVVVNLSYAVSTAIVGGQLLVAVSNDRIPQWLGILILILASWVVAFFGIRLIHTVLRYVWIVSLVLIIAIYIHSAKFWPDTAERNTASLEGPEHIGGAFTYFSIVFGSVIAWTTMADDYYVHYPADISKKLVFALTFTGMASSLCFSIPVGALVGSAIYLHTDLTMIYDTGNVGKIIKAILTPAAWGNAACVLYFLTTSMSSIPMQSCFSDIHSRQPISPHLLKRPFSTNHPQIPLRHPPFCLVHNHRSNRSQSRDRWQELPLGYHQQRVEYARLLRCLVRRLSGDRTLRLSSTVEWLQCGKMEREGCLADWNCGDLCVGQWIRAGVSGDDADLGMYCPCLEEKK